MVEALNKNTEKTTEKLGKASLNYMRKRYQTSGENGKKGLKDHVGNINLHAKYNRYKKGFIISSGDDEIAVYNEFGTGIVGAENPNPLAGDIGYQYNIGITKGIIPDGAKKEYGEEYCEKVTTPNTWWYRKNNKWWHTEGMKGKNLYYDLAELLRGVSKEKYETAVRQSIVEYKKHYTQSIDEEEE